MQDCYVVIVLWYLCFVADSFLVTNKVVNTIKSTRNRRDTGNKSCVLPPHPENGQWKLLNGELAKPFDNITEKAGIKFECTDGYKLYPKNPIRVCDETWNSLQIPECEKACPPLYPSSTYKLKCRNKNGKDIKCDEATHASFVLYTCAPYYEIPSGYKKTLVCLNGKWSQKPICQPVCGQKVNQENVIAKPLIYGGTPSTIVEYPWVTALYQKGDGSFAYVCGGTILSLSLVLTAAHCVANEHGDALPKEDFRIGAGKLHSRYEAPEDTIAQYLELAKIIVHHKYNGENSNFLGDIAVLVVKKEFQLNAIVQPVCFQNMNNIYLHPGNIGEVSGWGETETELQSAKLRSVKIPYKYEPSCLQELPAEWIEKYNSIDKMCAGFIDNSTGVCDGDSGGGLIFKNTEDNRYYIHGIVSLAVRKNRHCDIQQNSLYTKVAFYYEYLDSLLTKYAAPVRDCDLPPYPENGKWSTEEQGSKPGDYVSGSTRLKVECNQGYNLSTAQPNIECASAQNMGTCDKICPTLKFPQGTEYLCTNNSGQIIDCSVADDKSRLTYNCPAGYKIPENSSNSRICMNGSWGTPKPECEKIPKNCGKRVSTTEGLAQPWTVFLYVRKTKKKTKEGKQIYIGKQIEFVFGGTLISHKLVLTGGGALLEHDRYIIPKEDCFIAMGKQYTKYNDPRDTQAQYSEVSDIIVHPKYTGIKTRYLADISIVVAKSSFVFNAFVQPICFVDLNTIQLHQGDKGLLSKYIKNEKQQDIEIIFKDEEICHKELPSYFEKKYLISDKMCAGFDSNMSSPCRFHTGKGFSVKNPEDGRYYIHGVASSTPLKLIGGEKVCDRNSLYTKTSSYYDFIKDILIQYE